MSPSKRSAIWPIVCLPFIAWSALCLLLGLTTTLAYVPMGVLNLAVGLAIATTKAAIIAIVFMELSKASGVTRLASLAGVFWLVFLFLLMFADYFAR